MLEIVFRPAMWTNLKDSHTTLLIVCLSAVPRIQRLKKLEKREAESPQ
jgi:hypothetical protein